MDLVTYIDIYTYVCVCIHTRTYTYLYTYMQKYTCTHACIYAYVNYAHRYIKTQYKDICHSQK